MFSLCSHGVLTVFSPCSQLCSQLCSHCVIPVLSPCLLRGFEMNSHRARTMLCLPLPRSISLYKLTHHISRMLPPPDQTGGVRQASMGPACLLVFGSPASPEDLAIPEPGSGVAAPLHTLSADPQRCQVRLDVGGLASGTPAKPCSWRARLSGGTPEKTPPKGHVAARASVCGSTGGAPQAEPLLNLARSEQGLAGVALRAPLRLSREPVR